MVNNGTEGGHKGRWQVQGQGVCQGGQVPGGRGRGGGTCLPARGVK